MKYITFTVPCYNSEAYMDRCIESILPCGDNSEIIIVDDGSTDGTGRMADEYAGKYPDTVKVIHKANGGHGSAVNAGLNAAVGRYFKVVDSDDWLDREDLSRLIAQIKEWERENQRVDLVICNYIYDHLFEGKKKVIRYHNVFNSGRTGTWNDLGRFYPSQYLIMHALIYRTEMLRGCGICLPEHTFYVDNVFANQPLPFVKSICYLDLDLYHYFLGREDQSVNEEVLKQRIDQQILVTKIVSQCTDLEAVALIYPKLADCLVRNISVMMAISSIHLLLINDSKSWKKREELWNFVKRHDYSLYRRLKYRSLSGLTKLPGRAGRFFTVAGYKTARKLYHFN